MKIAVPDQHLAALPFYALNCNASFVPGKDEFKQAAVGKGASIIIIFLSLLLRSAKHTAFYQLIVSIPPLIVLFCAGLFLR